MAGLKGISRIVLSVLVLFGLAASCCGVVLFSTLPRTFTVTATPSEQVLRGGVDKITVTWEMNQTLPAGTDSDYKTIKIKLCYAPISQQDRPWRKSNNELKKDKTCQHKIVARPYNKTVQSLDWTVERDVPTATYFVRVYAYNAEDVEVAYGQSTDAHKTTNLFQVDAITGRHASLDIAAVCFSVFSIVALAGFFVNEKRIAKRK